MPESASVTSVTFNSSCSRFTLITFIQPPPARALHVLWPFLLSRPIINHVKRQMTKKKQLMTLENINFTIIKRCLMSRAESMLKLFFSLGSDILIVVLICSRRRRNIFILVSLFYERLIFHDGKINSEIKCIHNPFLVLSEPSMEKFARTKKLRFKTFL